MGNLLWPSSDNPKKMHVMKYMRDIIDMRMYYYDYDVYDKPQYAAKL